MGLAPVDDVNANDVNLMSMILNVFDWLGGFPYVAFSLRGVSLRGVSLRGFPSTGRFPTRGFPYGRFPLRGFPPTGGFPTGGSAPYASRRRVDNISPDAFSRRVDNIESPTLFGVG